jgi:hypothetical protein
MVHWVKLTAVAVREFLYSEHVTLQLRYLSRCPSEPLGAARPCRAHSLHGVSLLAVSSICPAKGKGLHDRMCLRLTQQAAAG